MIMRAARQVALRKQENVFITGEYGIGKSSVAAFVREAAERECQLTGFHVFLGGVATLEEMIGQVVSSVVQQAHSRGQFDRLRGLLGRYVKELTLFGVTLNLEAVRRDAAEMSRGFLGFLRQIHLSLAEHHAGMILVLDDLNGITSEPRFASLLKSTVAEIAVGGRPLPLLLILTGAPERREEMIRHQPSIARIFQIAEISPLEEVQVKAFYVKAFQSVGFRVEKKALGLMARWAGGQPKLMHEIGEQTFWRSQAHLITPEVAQLGILAAADAVGRKYFASIQHALRSADYHSILKKIGAMDVGLSFSKADVERRLSESEKRKLNSFLQRMKKLGGLRPGASRGEWVFPNELLRLYLLMEAG